MTMISKHVVQYSKPYITKVRSKYEKCERQKHHQLPNIGTASRFLSMPKNRLTVRLKSQRRTVMNYG